MELYEKTISSQLIYDGKIIRVQKDKAEVPNGHQVTRELVCHPGGVCIAAVTEQQEIYFVRQFRYPFQKVLLELPAGKKDPGEEPLQAGKRELEEEIGMIAEKFEDLGDFYPSVGFLDEVLHCYLATGLTPTQQHLDDDEFLNIEKMPLSEAYQMVLRGEIPDGKTQAVILKTWCKLHEETDKK